MGQTILKVNVMEIINQGYEVYMHTKRTTFTDGIYKLTITKKKEEKKIIFETAEQINEQIRKAIRINNKKRADSK